MLKQLISLLLSKFFSKQETALVGHQAMPSTTWVAIALNSTTHNASWSNIGSYVPPADGYIQLMATSLGDGSQLCIRTWSGDKIRGSYLSRMKNQTGGVNLPVIKGFTYQLMGSWCDGIEARFYPIVGGGYKLFKKYSLLGGAICLKSLLTCLQRNFSTKNGLKSQPLHLPSLKRILKFQRDSMVRTNGVMSLRLRSMGGSELRLLQQRQSLSILVPMAVRCVNLLLERHLDLSHVFVEYRRVRVLITSSLQRGLFRIDEFCLFQATVPSLVNGGASC